MAGRYRFLPLSAYLRLVVCLEKRVLYGIQTDETNEWKTLGSMWEDLAFWCGSIEFEKNICLFPSDLAALPSVALWTSRVFPLSPFGDKNRFVFAFFSYILLPTKEAKVLPRSYCIDGGLASCYRWQIKSEADHKFHFELNIWCDYLLCSSSWRLSLFVHSRRKPSKKTNL